MILISRSLRFQVAILLEIKQISLFGWFLQAKKFENWVSLDRLTLEMPHVHTLQILLEMVEIVAKQRST